MGLGAQQTSKYEELQKEAANADLVDLAKEDSEFANGATTLAVRFKDVIIQLLRTNNAGSEDGALAGLAVLATNFSASRWLDGTQDVRFKDRKFTTRSITTRSAANYLCSKLGGKETDSTDLTAAQLANLMLFVSAYPDSADGLKGIVHSRGPDWR